MAVIHVWDEFKRSDHGRTLWVKLDDAEARINKLEAEVAERESALEELSEMLAESYFFLMNPDHPSTVHKRAEIAALDESEGREDWRDYLREEAQQPYFGPNMQPPAWWSARREAEATVERLTWMLERAECIATDLRQDHLEDRDWQELKNQLHTNLQVRWAERGQE